jgi:hypothetical protein
LPQKRHPIRNLHAAPRDSPKPPENYRLISSHFFFLRGTHGEASDNATSYVYANAMSYVYDVRGGCMETSGDVSSPRAFTSEFVLASVRSSHVSWRDSRIRVERPRAAQIFSCDSEKFDRFLSLRCFSPSRISL